MRAVFCCRRSARANRSGPPCVPSNKPKNSFCRRSVIGPRLPSPTVNLVDRAHRRDLGGRAGQEHLVGDVQQLARDVLLDDLEPRGLRELRHAVARDARQDRRRDRRRVQLAVLHEEQVLAGALADEAGRVQREALGEAEAARLERHERARQIVAAGLRQRGHRVRRDALPRRHADVDAFFERALAEIRAPLPRGDRHARRLLDVARHAHLAVAAKRDRPNVSALQQIVLAHDVAARAPRASRS